MLGIAKFMDSTTLTHLEHPYKILKKKKRKNKKKKTKLEDKWHIYNSNLLHGCGWVSHSEFF